LPGCRLDELQGPPEAFCCPEGVWVWGQFDAGCGADGIGGAEDGFGFGHAANEMDLVSVGGEESIGQGLAEVVKGVGGLVEDGDAALGIFTR
jgi:hypothetical protein